MLVRGDPLDTTVKRLDRMWADEVWNGMTCEDAISFTLKLLNKTGMRDYYIKRELMAYMRIAAALRVPELKINWRDAEREIVRELGTIATSESAKNALARLRKKQREMASYSQFLKAQSLKNRQSATAT